jgi:hypothetical protein
MFLGLAIVLGIGIDRLHRDRWLANHVHRFRPALVGAFGIAVCLVPLVPGPYRMVDVERPEFFEREVKDALPTGSVLLTYPFPGPLTAETMEWQANADMHYRIVGGYGFVPDEQGSFTLQGSKGFTQEYLASLYEGDAPSRLTPSAREEILTELKTWEVDAIAGVLDSPGADDAVRLFTELFGRPPRIEGGVALWDSFKLRP